MSSTKIVLKFLTIYITIISLFAALMLLFSISEIINKGNLILLLCLFLVAFISISNILFVFGKNRQANYKYQLLYNGVFSFLFAFKLRLKGFLFSYLIGTQISIYGIQNPAGTHFGFKFDWFDIALIFAQYDETKNTGYLIYANLFMITIGLFFLNSFFFKIKRSF